MNRVEFSWTQIIKDTNDEGILLLMEDQKIYVNDYNYLIINGKEHITSTEMLNRIRRLIDVKVINDREKIIDRLL